MKKKNSGKNNKNLKKNKRIKKNIEENTEKVNEEELGKTEVIEIPEKVVEEKGSKEFNSVIEDALNFTEPQVPKKNNKKLFVFLGFGILFCLSILVYFLFLERLFHLSMIRVIMLLMF